MQIYDFISIKRQVITGVKNPLLTIEGTCSKKNVSFIVLEDGDEIEYTRYNTAEKDGFGLSAVLKFDSKYIKVYALDGDKRFLIFNSKMSLFNRVSHKLESMVTSIYTLLKAFFVTLKKGIKYFWDDYHFLVPPKLWGKYLKDFIHRVKERGVKYYREPNDINEYNDWISEYEVTEEEEELEYKPLISVLIPVYNVSYNLLAKCIDSILNNTYQNFEICLVDDASTNEETLKALDDYEKKDVRVRVKHRKENGHISRTTNDALKMAKGEFVALVDNDDEITPNAFYEFVKALNNNKKLDFIYSDEDKLNENGRRCYPNFKPDFSPDTLLSSNYICHLTMIRKSLVEEVGGFEVGLEGAQDHDLFLKCTEKTNNIYHIPKILYHWRIIPGSTADKIDNKSYALEMGRKSVENALKRRGIDAEVVIDEPSIHYIIKYKIKKEPLVSIIIPTKDYADITRTCLESIYKKTTYKNYEIILMNNNSEKQETFDLFEEFKNKHKNFKVIDANYEFNYSRINNEAVKHSKGEYICLLNNDTEVISPDWLTVMVSYAMQDHIGCVGPKLLFPDDTVQHGGVIIGLGGIASHAYMGNYKDDLGDYGRLRVPYNYAAVTAACLVVKKSKYLEVKGLEENLKVAYNDIDFNLKLLEKGYYNIFVPQVELHHYESKSRGYDTTPEKYERFKKEEEFMYEKWNKYIENDPFYNPNYTKQRWFKIEK